VERLRRAGKLCIEAEREFEQKFGAERSAHLRALLAEVASCDLERAEP
jgi:hypothetical protein